jgi:hypothetical protein
MLGHYYRVSYGGASGTSTPYVRPHFSVLYPEAKLTNFSQWVAMDGTSASTPAFAGLITLINQMRISAYLHLSDTHTNDKVADRLGNRGKAQLGFLNPALYQMATERPSAFTDVVSGTNKANMGYVCQYGWAATDGWDAATGVRPSQNTRTHAHTHDTHDAHTRTLTHTENND